MSVKLYKQWLTEKEADDIMNRIDELGLGQIKYAGRYPMPRLTAWFSTNGTPYSYSKQSTPSQPFPDFMQHLRHRLFAEFGEEFDSCLANFYRNGNDSVSWHQDDESIFPKGSPIVSISFGATRTFDMKSDKERLSYDLSHGDMIMFDKEHKELYKHQVKKQPLVTEPRLNLTFRVLK